MKEWELSDEEIGDKLDLEKDYTYPCSDGSKLMTIDCREVAQAAQRTLVKWLEGDCDREHGYSVKRLECPVCWSILKKELGE